MTGRIRLLPNGLSAGPMGPLALPGPLGPPGPRRPRPDIWFFY